jgi:citrate lyase synthetase
MREAMPAKEGPGVVMAARSSGCTFRTLSTLLNLQLKAQQQKWFFYTGPDHSLYAKYAVYT